ncbi:MAG: radical SAM protein [Anaerolineae bacterium]|nr:radical SAM protein [Anaerolineae bacterium]
MTLNVVLISTYELGRQPFGLASPAAWISTIGAHVDCLDLAVTALNPECIKNAHLIAFYVPMHMGTRMTVPIIEQVKSINPEAHLCCYGLYAPMSEEYLRRLGVDTILGGEFETSLAHLAQRLTDSQTAINRTNDASSKSQPEPVISLDRQDFLVPRRSGLPQLNQYAHLVKSDGHHVTVGYTEASRGCKHTCRHCPIVPVYDGRFRIVQKEVVLADIRQQVEAGAQHITFGDPDFFNGPRHALSIINSLHEDFPALTYDVIIKVEHLLKHAAHLPTLKETGCLFITSAVESFDDNTLAIFAKNHTQADFEAALNLCRERDLLLVPTFVAFNPWTTLAEYRHFLREIVRLDLVDQVSPIQCAIRLLIPPGSRLLDLPTVRDVVGELDASKLSYTWQNPDPRVDQLQRDLEYLVQSCAAREVPRREVFRRIWEHAFEAIGDAEGNVPFPNLPPWSRFIPYLSEPWYC